MSAPVSSFSLPPPVSSLPHAAEAYHIPSLGYRIVVATLRLVPLIVVLVGIPVAALTYLQSRSITLPVSINTVLVYGVLLCAMSTARYILRPTRAYGPVSMATAAVTIVFFLTLLVQSTYHLGVPQSTAVISVTYTDLIEILLVVPVLALVAGLVTTIEDLRSPTERLQFDFPP